MDDLGINLRSVPLKTYLIIFSYDGERLDVLHVIHGHRDLRAYFAGPRE